MVAPRVILYGITVDTVCSVVYTSTALITKVKRKNLRIIEVIDFAFVCVTISNINRKVAP